MQINVLTLFPNMFDSFVSESIIRRALDKQAFSLSLYNFRDYSKSKHLKVDDYQYGGMEGMLLSVEPIYYCLEDIKNKGKVYALSPRGKVINQAMLEELKSLDAVTFICGHYEGFDERVYEYCDGSISLGDYILTGGELGAMVLIDGMVRLLDGVISSESVKNESFSTNLLEAAQYTRPACFNGSCVPEVLLNGNHKLIEEFKVNSALEITKKCRPDLLERVVKK